MSGPVQVVTSLSICIRSDAQTVGGVELLHEEGAAGLNHRGQLQQTGRRQQRLDGVLPQIQTTWRIGDMEVLAGPVLEPGGLRGSSTWCEGEEHVHLFLKAEK